MTLLELSKAFEVTLDETVERQTRLIKESFEEKLDFIKDHISSYLNAYDENDSIHVGIIVPFICLDSVHAWAYEYFEEMDNVEVMSILTGFSYSANKDITQIELNITL